MKNCLLIVKHSLAGCTITGFDGAPGTSLPSHSSLCRSDSGFHAITGTLEELSLDLAPIEEHQNSPRPLSELFGNNSKFYFVFMLGLDVYSKKLHNNVICSYYFKN
uniref:Uncharacterized protein n=1 Tax=Heterorhabditis bacteriophora TaxID=37862 RepID=A0A1I7WU38_HETBA